jgi:hypothetical protein
LGEYFDDFGSAAGPLRGHLLLPISLALYGYGNSAPTSHGDADGQVVPFIFFVAVAVIAALTLKHSEDEEGAQKFVAGSAMLACGGNPTCAAGAGSFHVGKQYGEIGVGVKAYAEGRNSEGDAAMRQSVGDGLAGVMFLAGARTPKEVVQPRSGEMPPGCLAGKCNEIAEKIIAANKGAKPISPPGSIHGHVGVKLPNGRIVDPSLRDNLKALGQKVDDIPVGQTTFSEAEWSKFADRFPKGEPPPPGYKEPPW